MVVFSEISPCRLDRNAPDLGGGGVGGLTTEGVTFQLRATHFTLTSLRTSNLGSTNSLEIYSYACVKVRKKNMANF